MPLLSQEDTIKGYWEEVKDKYPNISFDNFVEICKAPFNYVKKCIQVGDLPFILVKYLGKFRVYQGEIKRAITKNKVFFEKGIIDEWTFKKNDEFYTRYLKDVQDYDSKSPETDTEG